VKRGLIWSSVARRDLLGNIRYIADDNESAATRVADRIDKAALALAGRPTGRPGRAAGTYEKSLPGLPYILAYRIVASADGSETIGILRVIHAARNWPPGQWPEEGC